MLLLDGKKVAEATKNGIREEIASLLPKAGRAPVLAVILVGEDPASQVYVRSKEKACAALGITSRPYRLPADSKQADIEALIRSLSEDEGVDGILLQLPLPKGLDPQPCLDAIAPEKDVDGLHPVNQGLLCAGRPGLRPCTPSGALRILDFYGISTSGKNAVVIGRSDLVGRPLAIMLGQKGRDATVTLCHSKTKDLAAVCREADIIFPAIGRPRLLTADMVREGVVIVDIGINRLPEGLCGDADFEGLKEKAGAMTPVPGGVGPMTITELMANTLTAWKDRLGLGA